MQTLDVQNDMQPVNYAEAAQSSNTEKKTVKEPERHGTSFPDMIKNIMAEQAEARAPGADALSGNRESAESAARKNKDTAETALSRLKMRGALQKGDEDSPIGQSKAGVPAEKTGVLPDSEALLASAEGIAVKTVLESKTGDVRLRSPLSVNAETESVLEEEAALVADALSYTKKQRRGKSESGLASATSSTATALPEKRNENAAKHTEGNGLEKSAGTQQIKRQKPVFTVIDERTVQAAPVTADGSVHEAGAAVRTVDIPSLDMTADFRGMGAGFRSASEGTHAAKEGGSQHFASLVVQQVQDMAPDFVQAGKIVLQDNNAGIIRLQMQPAHLGNVRINLELAGDKKIVGRIIAGSKEAYEAFKESVGLLSEAFEQGGFASAQFDVSWSGESGGRQGEGSGQFNELFTQNDRLEVIQGNRYADNEAVYVFGQDQAVNVFA